MLDAIRHRGPDDGASTPLGACVLGHRRLRVIDLETGEQPVTDESGEIVAVFNGEIYNFQALREELAADGHQVRGTGDTPIIPHLYEQHGERFVERLHGMFALALWDGRRQRLVLARDRVGKKPLLWTRLADGTLAFASELKALAAPARASRASSTSPRSTRFSRSSTSPAPGPRCAASTGCRPATCSSPTRTASGSSATGSRRPAELRLSEDEWLERVRGTVREAVRKRLVADVPLGALLSGGIDSSIVVSQMAQLQPEPVRTFSVGFADARYDERAARAARRGALRHGARGGAARAGRGRAAAPARRRLRRAVRRLLGPADVPRLARSRGAPSPSRSSATAATRSSAATSATRRTRSPARLDRALPSGLLRAGARSLRALPSGRSELRSPVVRAARFLDAAGADSAERYGRLMEIFPALRCDGRSGRTRRSRRSAARRRRASCSDRRPRRESPGCSCSTSTTYLPGDLLYKADIASMACSLELRAPFLDHEVVELGLGLPDSLKVRGDARQGRAPARVRRRPAAARSSASASAGSAFPSRAGSGPSCASSRATCCSASAPRRAASSAAAPSRPCSPTTSPGAADHGARLWSLVMLELWQREYVDHAAVAAAARRRSVSPPRRTSSIVAAACVVPRLCVLLFERGKVLSEYTEKSDDFARTFVDSGTYGFIPGEPSAWTQPLYGFFLIPLYEVFGRAWLAVGLAQIAIALGDGAARLRDRPARDLAGRRPRRSASSSALHPYLVWHDVHVNREVLDTLLAAALVLLTLELADAARRWSARRWPPAPSPGSRSSATRA